jgi:hypothetical protein
VQLASNLDVIVVMPPIEQKISPTIFRKYCNFLHLIFLRNCLHKNISYLLLLGSRGQECMVLDHSRPGDTVVKCNDCEHLWAYSGSRELATCPKCGLNSRVMDHQQGMVLSSDAGIHIKIDRYNQTVRRALSLGLKQGGSDYRKGIAEVFPTTGGEFRGF